MRSTCLSGRSPVVQLSSRPLGWRTINVERHEAQPSGRELPYGSREHLVFVSLSEGCVVREAPDGPVCHRLLPGFVTVVPRAMAIRWSWQTPIRYVVLGLEPRFFDSIAGQVTGCSPSAGLTLSERAQDPMIASIASLLVREASTGDASSPKVAEAAAALLAVHLCRHYSATGRIERIGRSRAMPGAIARALAFIDRHYSRRLSIADMAAAACLSPFHFSRLFRRYTGLTAHEYLVRRRVQQARSLLASAERISLAEIALAVGFVDQSHLARQFKRIVGLTPGRFRARRSVPRVDPAPCHSTMGQGADSVPSRAFENTILERGTD